MKVLVTLICLIWQSIFLIYATKNFLKKRPRKEPIAQYSKVPLRQQLLIIAVLMELLNIVQQDLFLVFSLKSSLLHKLEKLIAKLNKLK